ncbi:MAG: hypothetical protein GYA52_11545 [Chloroflexi bacterium]|nr:hypothetical protein [Chloroflexota bacterium]
MGLDYSFRLYFNKARIWDVLQGVVEIGQPHHPPARILFPDHVLEIPLDAWVARSNEFHCDNPELQFATVLNFAEDEPLWEYVTERDHSDEQYRSPPGDGNPRMISIGYIYLYIYQDLSDRHPLNLPVDLVLFEFGTTGTRMSILFEYSMSIRKRFTELLQRFHGVCGVFDRELEGEVFWFHDLLVDPQPCDPWALPEQIAQDLDRQG